MGRVLFFGYGANKSRSKIQQIIGKDPGLGVGAILEGYTLNLQSINQIPDIPRQILLKLYSGEFKAYTIRKGDGVVVGAIWEIEEEDLNKIKEWEFVDVWREIIEVSVKTSSEETLKVITEKAKDEFQTEFIVDGLLYDVFGFTKKASDPTKDQYYTQKQLAKIRSWIAKETNKRRIS